MSTNLSMDGQTPIAGMADAVLEKLNPNPEFIFMKRPYLLPNRKGSFITKRVGDNYESFTTNCKAVLFRDEWMAMDQAAITGFRIGSQIAQFIARKGDCFFDLGEGGLAKTFLQYHEPAEGTDYEDKGMFDVITLPLPLATKRFNFDQTTRSMQPAYTAGLDCGRLVDRMVLGLLEPFAYGGATNKGIIHCATVITPAAEGTTPMEGYREAVSRLHDANFHGPYLFLYPKLIEQEITDSDKDRLLRRAEGSTLCRPSEELYKTALVVQLTPNVIRMVTGPVLTIESGIGQFSVISLCVPQIRYNFKKNTGIALIRLG